MLAIKTCFLISSFILITGKNLEEEWIEKVKSVAAEKTNDRHTRAIPDIFDDAVEDFDFYEEFARLDDNADLQFEVDDIPPPKGPLALHVSLYLDRFWLDTHKSYARETARQILKQASLMLTHPSLDIKVQLVATEELYEIPDMEPVQMNSSKGLERSMATFERFLKSPLDILGSPVAHVLLTADPQAVIKGAGRLSSVCSSRTKPLAIVNWIRNTPRTVITLAHEIGHILGMHHDFKPVAERSEQMRTCGEGKNKGDLIMNYGEPRRVWSACSNQDFKRLYDSVVYTHGKFCLTEAGNLQTVTTHRPPVQSSSGWGEWGSWSQCSKSCCVGRWTRSRHCSAGCRNKVMSQDRFCNTQPC